MSKNVRIVLWDIETLPDLDKAVEYWPRVGDYPGLTLKATLNSIACVGFKELGSPKTYCLNVWDYPGWRKSVNDDRELCKAAYDVIKDADVVVTHNGKRFDWKFLQSRLLLHGFPPLPKIIHIDTAQESKKHLFLFNNRLNTVAEFVKAPKKMENGGWQLWVDVSRKKKSAMELMTKYCKQDVKTLEAVFKKLRPLIKGLPNENQFHKLECCPSCGSQKIQARGMRVQKEKTYRRFQCQECGSWSAAQATGIREL